MYVVLMVVTLNDTERARCLVASPRHETGAMIHLTNPGPSLDDHHHGKLCPQSKGLIYSTQNPLSHSSFLTFTVKTSKRISTGNRMQPLLPKRFGIAYVHVCTCISIDRQRPGRIIGMIGMLGIAHGIDL